MIERYILLFAIGWTIWFTSKIYYRKTWGLQDNWRTYGYKGKDCVCNTSHKEGYTK